MTHTRRRVPALVTLALAACATPACASLVCARPASAAAGANRSPLPRSQYAIRRACSAPLPGHAACMASELVPTGAEARAHRHPLGLAQIVQPQAPSAAAGDFGLRPQDLHSAYRLPLSASSEQTIAIVDAYNDPAAEADLRTFDEEFGLPACTAANGCLQQVNEHGESTGLPFPKTIAELNTARSTKPGLAKEATGWGLEISLDIETAHAVCQSCDIALVEASSPLDSDLETAETTAEALGAQEVSNSWGGPEQGETEAAERKGPFDHPGTVITASAGDNGYLDWDSGADAVEFPAASPHVVAVGGTHLQLTAKRAWVSESVWNGLGAGGGGCSTVFTAPAWQTEVSDWSGVGCSITRAVADVAADADPYTGVAVEDSLDPECEYSYTEGAVKHVQHWCTLGGTSLASPLIAATFALVGGAHGVDYPAETLYENAAAEPASLHDVTSGSNGECAQPYNSLSGESGCTTAQEGAACSSEAICLAGSGYDGPSGLGTPNGTAAFEPTGEGEESDKGGGTGGEEENEAGEEPPSSEGGPPPAEGPSGGAPNPGAGGGSPEVPDGSPGSGEPEEEESEEAEEENVISSLALAPASAQAAQSGHHKLAQLQFSFSASLATRVHVSLAKQVLSHRHTRWHMLHRATSLSALRGHNSGRLATGPLAPGTYRLTLTPRTGAARSLVFHIR